MRFREPGKRISPEIEMLLLCARTRLDAAQAARLEALAASEPDWNAALTLGHHNGMLPFLYWHLKELPEGAVPDSVLAPLQEFFQGNLKVNLRLTGELTRLLRAFAAEGVVAVPYKGPVQAVCLYGNLALRDFCDLDIVIRREDFARAKAVLIAQQYRPETALTLAQETALLRAECEFHFLSATSRACIELHWNLLAPRFRMRFPLDAMWQRLQPVTLAGMQAQTFSPEDTLLILAVHAAKHGWGRLEFLTGLSEQIRRAPDLDWPQVMAMAGRMAARRVLAVSLWLARDLLETPLPENILREIEADAALAPLARQAHAWLFPQDGADFGMEDQKKFLVRVRERRGDRILCRLAIALGPSLDDVRSLALPAPLLPLYALVRPFRLGAKWLSQRPAGR